jgi:hypothetical protein
VNADGNPGSASQRSLVAAIRDANPHISIFAMAAEEMPSDYEGELLELGATGIAASVSELSALLGHASYRYFVCPPDQLVAA